MAHQSYLLTEKYRQWVKAGLGLGYLKEGLAPFCDDVAKQQHKDILDNIKQTTNVPSIICGTCNIKTLQPDHVKLGNKQCPLGHTNCNCCYTSGKLPCPNKVCGAIYDNIINYHASTPPAPNWKNTQTQQWIADPWSIAKCFINAPGYEQKTSAADTDCTGLLHVIINNKYFHNHVNMTCPNIFSKVRQYRNEIFHSSSMELDSTKTNSYIDDMIAVLQDGKELIHRQDATEAVKRLQDLRKEAFIITTEDLEKVLGDIREDLSSIRATTEGLAKENEDQKRKFASIESKTFELEKEVKYLKGISPKKEYESSKADLQEELIKEYRDFLLRMPAMPCHPDHECNFEQVYVTPRLTLKSKDKDGKDIETEVETISDIFIKDDKTLKSVFILGEAGSGKSSFCKSLVQCWCLAHNKTQDVDGHKVEDTEYHQELIQLMNKFSFLFFLPLRDCTDKISIAEMLKEKYEHDILKELLKRESETCLIVLDGLDEWTHTTKYPPMRATFSKYTVLTTSRPWKIGSLGIKDNEMRQSIYIKGFGDTSRMNMITNTLKILQAKFPESKRGKDSNGPRECKRVLAEEPFNSLTHTAMMLQQLICLWFDDKLHATSQCHIYTCMLDLLFVWHKEKFNKSKEPDMTLFDDMIKQSHCTELPELLAKTDECKSYSYIIQGVSQLAYEILFRNDKEISLTFDSSIFQQLGISGEIKSCCLSLGILSEEKHPSLSASKSRKSQISFIHKSVQEYLAAVYIVMSINTEQESPLAMESDGLSDYLSIMLNIKTVDEVLENENVLIMLCGVEPRLAKSISKFIHDIVAKDKSVVRYRNTIDNTDEDELLIYNIQQLILKCIEEIKATNKLQKFSFHLGDLGIDRYQNVNNRSLFKVVNEQHITLNSVVSFHIYAKEGEYDGRILDCMTKCRNLEAIKIKGKLYEEVYQRLYDNIESNVSMLKCLSIEVENIFTAPLCRPLFCHFSNMTHLVALKIESFTVTHEDFTSLCTFISGTGNLQQISIDIDCECNQQHEVDLTKHKQLQYLKYCNHVVVTNVVSTNLEVIWYLPFDKINCIPVLDFLNDSKKLKQINIDLSFSKIIKFSEQRDYYTTITSKLTHVISLSQQLRELYLDGFTFTDNIIKCPSEMKSLKSICISRGTMSLTTWRKFIDSVAALPQSLDVKAYSMCITRDGEECNSDIDWRRGGGEEAAALQYVREREVLFEVQHEAENAILFLTKK